jgi:hypothetical protein
LTPSRSLQGARKRPRGGLRPADSPIRSTIIAQGDGTASGSRVFPDDEVSDEQSPVGVNAQTSYRSTPWAKPALGQVVRFRNRKSRADSVDD